MGERRKCAQEGCQQPADRGSKWCSAHRDGKKTGPGGGPKGNQNARTHGAYAQYVPIVALKDALHLPPGDLRLEIAAARHVLSELLKADLTPAERVEGLNKASGALARLLRTNVTLEGGELKELIEAYDQYLADLGLGVKR